MIWGPQYLQILPVVEKLDAECEAYIKRRKLMRKTNSSGDKHDDENDSNSCIDSARNINVDGGGGDDVDDDER